VLDALIPQGFGVVGMLLLAPAALVWSVLVLGGAVALARRR
jgi:hypothetical protein